MSSNAQLAHHFPRAEATRADGSVDPHLAYWDLRFSNLCNLSCRSCGALFSTSWYEDHAALYGPPRHGRLIHAGRDPEDLWRQLEHHIPSLEKVTFGGGEPLIMEEHYRLLRELDRRGMYRVKLFYHTNFTVLDYRGLDVLSLWDRFETVNVGASLDASGARGELVRRGTDWARVEQNRRRMQRTCPRARFYVAPTISVLNALHLPDFHREWIERGLIEPDQISPSVLQEPSWLRIDVLPPSLKARCDERYREHVEWLAARGADEETRRSFLSALRFMHATDRSAELGAFVAWTRRLDQLRGEDTFAVLPELTPILHAAQP